MSTWVIIPVKPLNRAKSRLAADLSTEQRHQLAETMFRHVLSAVKATPQVLGTLVISRDNRALSIAREYDAKTLQETGTPELNAALTRATELLASWGVESVLVLPADLPLLRPEDITNILNRAQGIASVVVASDQNNDGTNALFLRPPGIIPYSYGAGSFARHKELALSLDIAPQVYYSPEIALDIDVVADLEKYQQLSGMSIS